MGSLAQQGLSLEFSSKKVERDKIEETIDSDRDRDRNMHKKT